MQIAWIVYGDLAQATGGYMYDRLIIDGLEARGHRVHVVSIDRGERIESAGGDVVVADELCFREVGPFFRRSRSALRVLLVHHLTQWETESETALAVRLGEARALRHADAIITTSEVTAARLRMQRARRALSVDVVEPGADRLPSRPNVADSNERSLRFLFVGALGPRKNVLLLLDAFARAARQTPSISLCIAGALRDPDYARAVRARVDGDDTLAARVTIVGELDDAALANELARAHALVLPSSFEGYGMIAAEAIFAGTPVIASRTGALVDIVGAGGMIVHPNDAAAFTHALVRFAREPSLRRALADRVATHARSLPAWNVQITCFEDALQRALARVAR